MHPKAIEVMKEIGIDISKHTSKHMNEFLNRKVNTVITVCGNADQACPIFPGQVNRYHWGFEDPAHAKEAKSRSMPSSVASAIKSSWSSRPMPTVCVNAQGPRHLAIENRYSKSPTMSTANVKDVVREKYEEAALRVQSGGPGSCCSASVSEASCDPITSKIHPPEQESELPDMALKASLGCGNPTALAELKAGETVLDLGSGGGIDVLLSARRVGPTGQAYGLDMTDEMLALAEENKRKSGLTNVRFLKGEIENIPLPSNSVDVIISNCVINLSGDKDSV